MNILLVNQFDHLLLEPILGIEEVLLDCESIEIAALLLDTLEASSYLVGVISCETEVVG